MYQLAVLCREMLAEWSAGRRNLVEDPSWYLFNTWRFEVYLKGLNQVVRRNHPEHPVTNLVLDGRC